MSRRWVIGLVVALILASLAIASVPLLKRLERYQETVDQGPSPEARANPYLAAQTFLRKQGMDVKNAQTLTTLPELGKQPQTLMLLDSRGNMTPSEVERVLAWTRSGGRLLFVAEQIWNENRGNSGDLLLDALQLRQFLSRDLQEQDRERQRAQAKPVIPLSVPDLQAPETPWPELTRLYVQNENDPAYMSFDPAFHLDDPEDHARSWANSADATHLLQMVYGNGLITVVTDAELWKTDAIGEYDNAWLLWYLSQDSTVTMLLRTDHDNLFGLLGKYFPQALFALALCLVAIVWHAGVRHGPMLPTHDRGRRRLSEHLRASADFILRREGQHAALRALQRDIFNRARQRHPGFEALAVTEQWQTLARLTGQSTSSVGKALRPRPEQRLSSSEFTRQVAYLQTLRNAL
jgi:hypothetical protein